MPSIVRYLAPKGSLKLHEEAWNASTYCRTVITNPGYMKDNFVLKLETFCAENDRGDLDNVHELDQKQLAKRKVVKIDIGNDAFPKDDGYDST